MIKSVKSEELGEMFFEGIMYYVPIVCISLIGFYGSKKDDNTYRFIMLSMLFLALIVTDSYDLSIYRWTYENGIHHGKEFVFDYLQDFFRNIGVKFIYFKSLWNIATVLILYFGLKKYTDYKSIIASSFLITPFLLGFQTQLRNSLSAAIVIFAIPDLIQGGRKNTVKYTICILIASLFHYSSLFYLVFLVLALFPKGTGWKFRVACIIVSVLATIILYMLVNRFDSLESPLSVKSNNGMIQNIINRLMLLFESDARLNLTGFLFYSLHLVCMYLFVTLCICKIKKQSKVEVQIFYSRISTIADMMLLILPTFVVSPVGSRLFYYMLPLCFGVIIQTIKSGFKMTFFHCKKNAILYWAYGLSLFVIVGVYSSLEDTKRIISSIY